MKFVKLKDLGIPVLLLIIGLLIAIGPGTLFSYCTKMTTSACSYSVAELHGIGAILVIESILLMVSKDRGVRRGLLIGILLTSLLTLLTITALIGVCDSSMMACNKSLLPWISVISVVGVLVSLIGYVLELKSNTD